MTFHETRSRATLAMLLLVLLGAPPVHGDLLGLYTFDDGLPTDSSGNDNHGTTVVDNSTLGGTLPKKAERRQ